MPSELMLEAPRSGSMPEAGHGRLRRVLFALRLDPAGKFGSLEEQTLTLARAFKERGSLFLPVFLRALDPETAGQYAQEGLEAEALDLTSFRLDTLGRLLRLIRRHQIEVVHWNFYHPLFNGYLWALSVTMPGIEHYFTDHISRGGAGPSPSGRQLKSRLKRALASRYRRIFCISDFVLDQVRRSSSPRAMRLHYFVNTCRFQPDASVRSELRATLSTADNFVAVIVAQLIKEKGVDVALHALGKLPENIALWVVGRGPEQAHLAALARDLGVEHRTRFVGPKRNVEPYLQAADCAVCPSTWAEGVGLVNLEALACGLPVVASRIGGIPEFIEDGRNGLLFAPGNPEELAERLRRLYDDLELRLRLGREARSVALERHSSQSLLDEHLALYREATT
jgi:glycosyltransferase involved in cell wall biosynthesis